MAAQHPPTEAVFKAASEWLSSTPAAASLPNDTKLEVGCLPSVESFASANASRADNSCTVYTNTSRQDSREFSPHHAPLTYRTGSRPSIFYPTPRAKYDAWTSNHAKYAAQTNGAEIARGRYIEIAKTVGWNGEGLQDDEEEEIDFDSSGSEDEPEAGPSSGTKGSGMGPRISMMSAPDDDR